MILCSLISPSETPITNTHNPVTLTITNQAIHRNRETMVTHAAASPDVRQHMNTKYNWTKNECDSIDWQPHGRALTNLPYHNRVNITKFIHGWIATNDRMNYYDPTIPTTCEACGEHTETNQHFLWCPNRARQTHRTALKMQFHKWLTLHMDEDMAHLLLEGLFEWSTKPSTLPKDITPTALQAVKDQEKIGWNQLWYGRLSSHWGATQAERRRKRKDNPDKKILQ